MCALIFVSVSGISLVEAKRNIVSKYFKNNFKREVELKSNALYLTMQNRKHFMILPRPSLPRRMQSLFIISTRILHKVIVSFIWLCNIVSISIQALDSTALVIIYASRVV